MGIKDLGRCGIAIALIGIVSSLCGCFGFRPFQPPPDEYEVWDRANSDEEDVRKSLLDCGYPSPFNSGKYEFSRNDYVLANLCMERLGFVYDSDMTWRGVCVPRGGESIPACAAGVEPPSPDPRKRLSSPFCQQFSKARICKP
jgi:hypothetical protein